MVLVVRTILLYALVILSLRIMGKRQIGEMQPSELVVAIMISDLAAVPMQAIDIPLATGIIPVLTLIGEINFKELKKTGMNEEWLKKELKKQHIKENEVFFAIYDCNKGLIAQKKGGEDKGV